MTWADALKLGRVSNLPTVWTNMVAGIVLAGGVVVEARTLALFVAMSLFYVGGMYLNDAFDAEIDARERPERPIPSGRVSRRLIYILGFAMLAAGIVIVAVVGDRFAPAGAMWPTIGAVALAAAIVVYDWYHKSNPLSPVVMGLCRMLVYITAGLCFVLPLPGALWIGAVLLLCYLIGLTYVAKQENLGKVENLWPLIFLAAPVVYGISLAAGQVIAAVFLLLFLGWMLLALWFVKRRQPGDIPRAVVSLIAGISLLDALLVAGTGAIGIAVLCVVGFVVTLALQRFVPGT
jgi:4-hydroxybenzoate polyprenyltransferase